MNAILALLIFASTAVALLFSYLSLNKNIGESSSSITKALSDNNNSSQKFDSNSARVYVRSMYNDSVGLVRENVISDRYWLWADNFLASSVLSGSHPQISTNITNTLQYYKSQFGIEYSSAWAVLNNNGIGKISFKASSDKQLSGKIWYTTYDGNDELKCEDHADIAFLKSIYLYKNNQLSEAKHCYDLGVSMFDGKGFRDKAFVSDGDTYSTYKLALWKIAVAETLFGITKDDSQIRDKILIAMQDPGTGGVFTHYKADLSPAGETNVETTSASIMAFDSQ